jgi:hypothetical protein
MLLLAGLFQNMSRLALQYGTVFRFWLFSELYVTLQDPDCVQVRMSSSNGNAKYVTKFSKDTFGAGWYLYAPGRSEHAVPFAHDNTLAIRTDWTSSRDQTTILRSSSPYPNTKQHASVFLLSCINFLCWVYKDSCRDIVKKY